MVVCKARISDFSAPFQTDSLLQQISLSLSSALFLRIPQNAYPTEVGTWAETCLASLF